MAAVLACGEGAALSHHSAAGLWGLLRAEQGLVDVSTPSRTGRGRRTGIRLHRCPSLVSGLVTERRGIPVTTPARTIADLRSVVPAWQWRRAVRQAEFAGYRLEIETDSYRYHRGSVAFEDDHARDLDLHALGIDIRRFTCDQIDSQPDRVAAAVREAPRIDPDDHRVRADGS
jgi:hypothetical protein